MGKDLSNMQTTLWRLFLKTLLLNFGTGAKTKTTTTKTTNTKINTTNKTMTRKITTKTTIGFSIFWRGGIFTISTHFKRLSGLLYAGLYFLGYSNSTFFVLWFEGMRWFLTKPLAKRSDCQKRISTNTNTTMRKTKLKFLKSF